MNTDYISYYFSPLVSWWYLVIYVTMFIGARYNDRTPFLICKILLSLTLVTFVMRETGDSVLNLVFGFLERACGIHWSAREWSFRVNLDLWIVYVGMFAALAVIKIREYRLTEHPQWPLAVKAAAVVSALVFLWFFAFELSMDKFQYNFYHPFTSSLPVLAFAVLRNANPVLRSASSKAFAFIGKCSLETFIIQYHFWLAGDTKGLLLVIPGTRWRPVNMMLTTIMFIYVSNCVSQATGELTKRICGSVPTPALPTVMEVSNPRIPPATGNDSESGQEIIFQAPPDELELPVRKDNAGNVLPSEPDTPARPQARWVDRLAQGSSRSSTPGVNIWHGKVEWQPGLKAKLLIALFGMWILNILWTYPATT
ncbi:hypothetical protein EW026_g4335 [Hermanssonia centrifuga]|uniref:Cas1p 10 TM acyl transferase domain-containing protein n=1 Tax=Hermanssonia centrifuga TaxID=98765 RepID=A0A4S4KJ84_9APHY|nr:hypothetical protein EW026_g4335 [Hermanssonia centrifuga]